MSEPKKYTIKPLKWTKLLVSSVAEYYRADVYAGTYIVVRRREDRKYAWSSWEWSFYLSTIHEDVVQCKTPTEGKRLAEEDWIKRILPALEEVE